MHVLNTTLPAHLSLFAYLDFACYSPLGISRFCVPRLCVLLTSWNISLLVYLDFACYSPLWSLSLLAYLDFACCNHHVVVVSFGGRGRMFCLIGLPLLSTCARMFDSTPLAVSHCLRTSTFCELQMDAFWEHVLRLGSDVVVESACDVGDWGPRLRRRLVRQA